MSEHKPIQLGLCCLNWTLRARKPTIFSARNVTQTFAMSKEEGKGVPLIKERILMNLQDTLTMMDWNEANGIKVFRLSSEMFPHKSNPKVPDYDFDFGNSLDLMKQIGEKSKKYGQRLTMHPGQYNVIGSPDEDKFQKTILDLEYQATVLDLMGCDENSVMVIHGGGTYGDKEKTMDRFCKNFKRLPECVQRRLVIENCEKCYNIEDCLEISKRINIPTVLDSHHFDCYKELHPKEEFKPEAYYVPLILKTWEKRGIKPKFHVSEQGHGKCGLHSDYIEVIPDYMLEIPEKYGVDIDIMIEAKKKELAIQKLYNKYPFMNCKKDGGKMEVDMKLVTNNKPRPPKEEADVAGPSKPRTAKAKKEVKKPAKKLKKEIKVKQEIESETESEAEPWSSSDSDGERPWEDIKIKRKPAPKSKSTSKSSSNTKDTNSDAKTTSKPSSKTTTTSAPKKRAIKEEVSDEGLGSDEKVEAPKPKKTRNSKPLAEQKKAYCKQVKSIQKKIQEIDMFKEAQEEEQPTRRSKRSEARRKKNYGVE